jgi:tRNA pseudouridine13 synthase
MRLKRTQQDFRVTELIDEDTLLGDGPYTVYRVTKRGLTTFEAADVLAQSAGVPRDAVAYAGLKDKDGVTGQFMTIEGGRRVDMRDGRLTVRAIGRSPRPVVSGDSSGNSFEIVVRDLSGDDMRRIRVNLTEVREGGVPNYFDDQRFGCLRHGQGFVVRSLLSGKPEDALRALLAAPSPYGSEQVEQFKAGIQQRWGDWPALAAYCRGRRGATVFEHLARDPEDFVGALERGIATRERTIHLFAWQAHLWNRAAGLLVREVVGEEGTAWLPGDAGSLPVYRKLEPAQQQRLEALRLPLLGPDAVLSEDAQRAYEAVFRSEGASIDAFLGLDIGGFRPQGEDRPLLVRPEFLRAAPAQPDEIYRRRQKMRLRFTLPRGHYATLVCKRLMMPTESGYAPLRMWVSRHPLDWPEDDGTPRREDPADRRHHSERGRPHAAEVGGPRRDDAWGGRREGSGNARRGERDERGGRDEHRGGRDQRRPDSPWGRASREDSGSRSPWGNKPGGKSPYGGKSGGYSGGDRSRGTGGGRRSGPPEGWPAGVPWKTGGGREDEE